MGIKIIYQLSTIGNQHGNPWSMMQVDLLHYHEIYTSTQDVPAMSPKIWWLEEVQDSDEWQYQIPKSKEIK